jgi:hypothetical protein
VEEVLEGELHVDERQVVVEQVAIANEKNRFKSSA